MCCQMYHCILTLHMILYTFYDTYFPSALITITEDSHVIFLQVNYFFALLATIRNHFVIKIVIAKSLSAFKVISLVYVLEGIAGSTSTNSLWLLSMAFRSKSDGDCQLLKACSFSPLPIFCLLLCCCVRGNTQPGLFSDSQHSSD